MNLFKLVKDQGFKIFYISAQSSGLTNNLDRQYVDVFVTVEDESRLFSKKWMMHCWKFWKNKSWMIKILWFYIKEIFIHLMKKNYSHRKNEFERFENSYDNVMLYNDYILS